MSDKPYTDTDVLELADVITDARMRGMATGGYSMALAVLDALAAAGRLLPTEPVNDIEATGRCCCAGCSGMGPCDRDLGRTDD